MWDDDEQFGFYEGECGGCDTYDRVNDLGLCEDCAGKLERDLIREKDWAYSVTAYGMSDERREEHYREVISRYGKAFELILPSRDGKGKRKAGKKRKGKGRGGSKHNP